MSTQQQRQSAPSAKRIIEYWKSQPQLPCGVTIDWDTAHEKCWCCGYSDPEFPQYTTERAHIIPHALGASSEPENFVLLCPECHHDSPDVNDSMAMWKWISKYSKYPYEMILEQHIFMLKQYLPVLYPETASDTRLFTKKLMTLFEGVSDQISSHGFNSVSNGTRLWYFKKVTDDVIDAANKVLYSDEYYKKLGLM